MIPPRSSVQIPLVYRHPDMAHDCRLLESSALQHEVSVAGSNERYGRGKTSHTIHVWWARRPHSAMRALIFAALSNDRSPSAVALMSRLTSEHQPRALQEAREALGDQYTRPPLVLDMFSGGGTIPFEAANLGAAAYAAESNQLAVFIQMCNLVYSQGLEGRDIPALLKKSGNRVLRKLAEKTAPLFPLRGETLFGHASTGIFGYFWTYMNRCASCRYRYFLSRRPWLSGGSQQRLGLLVHDRAASQEIVLGSISDTETTSVWQARGGRVTCPKCGHQEQNISIQSASEVLAAMVESGNRPGKHYRLADARAVPDRQTMAVLEADLLAEMRMELPASPLPVWSGIVNPALYGFQTHADILSPRQRLVVLYLLQALREEHAHLCDACDPQTARYATALLSSLVDQLIDWNSRLSMWIPQNEQVGRAFCGPGVAMLWDYVETDPVMSGPANLGAKLQRIIRAATAIPQFPVLPRVDHGFAQSLPFAEQRFDAIITDPPYYDNIYYSVLADFFYAWKRPLLHLLEPEIFDRAHTNGEAELVPSSFRSGSPAAAHQESCEQFTQAMKEAERVLKSNGIFVMIYSHSSLLGWEATLRALRATGLRVTCAQPMSIERRQRPRAMTSKAVNTCIAFVCRKAELPKTAMSAGVLSRRVAEVRDRLGPALEELGWAAADAGMAIFAYGIAQMANHETVTEWADDQAAMRALEGIIKEKYMGFKLLKRRPM